jgi:hypothetical protein
MTDDETVLGYFHWEGDPCRVIVATDGYNTKIAEIYVSGEGFQRIALSDLEAKGVPIGEAEFKERVMDTIALARRP